MTRERLAADFIPLAPFHAAGAWDVLVMALESPARCYHNGGHIVDMLERLRNLASLAARPDLIAAAIYWHDSVYETRAPDGALKPDRENVRQSAALFSRFSRFCEDDQDAIIDMIMATGDHLGARPAKDFYPKYRQDFDLFLDLDLASLSDAPEVFDAHTRNIRMEFSFVPEPLFCLGRAKILSDFAQRGEKIYRRTEIAERWSAPALANLNRSIATLLAAADKKA